MELFAVALERPPWASRLSVSRSFTGRSGTHFRLSALPLVSAILGFPYTPPELMPGEGALGSYGDCNT